MGRNGYRLSILFLLLALCFSAAAGQSIDPVLQDAPVLGELDSGVEGPVILVIAGIHGDEISGIRAAEMLSQLPLACGKLYWIPAANTYGAEMGRRKTRDDRDLNRNFPGDSAGNPTKQLAACLTQQILVLQPDLILDLHEATAWDDGWDNLGGSVIFADLDPVADLIFDLMDLDDAPNFFSSPPAGSLNTCFTATYGIPVLTLEASREDSLEARIDYHLRLIQWILSWYQML